ncbi:fungal-specific transcription factor domain-containing protein, partial [Gorgonomyces haynaldii]
NQSQLQIDPEVLNLYTQINPKLSLQQDLSNFLATQNNQKPQQSQATVDSLLYGPVNLSIPEVPNLQSDVFLHLISMFFTYFHPTAPLIDENRFFQNLIPSNNHHPMLLYAIYAVGCSYSRHPVLYQSPFYTPQKASQFFVNKALASVPPPESKNFSTFEAVEICQASLLLSCTDFLAKKCRTWMMLGMGTRLISRYEFQSMSNEPSFVTMFNGMRKIDVEATTEERKRLWWGGLLIDLFVSLSSGAPLMIDEEDFADTVISPSLFSKPDGHKLSTVAPFLAPHIHVHHGNNTIPTEMDKWKPYFSGFPKDTIFGGTDLTSERWKQPTMGFFQVNHLFSDLNEVSHLIQLSFITRRVLRCANRPQKTHMTEGPGYLLGALLPKNDDEAMRLHDVLIAWYVALPPHLRLWVSLESLHRDKVPEEGCSIPMGKQISSMAVQLNLLFFFTLALLHQKEAEKSSINFAGSPSQFQHQPIYRLHPSHSAMRGVTCVDMLVVSYRAQVHVIKLVYGQSAPTPTQVPPSEISGSGIVGCLLMAAPMALLSQSEYGMTLAEPASVPNSFPSIESLVLPVLENLAQVWPSCSHYASTFRML